MFDLNEFWEKFDSNPDKIIEDNLEVKLDNHPYVCIGTFYKTILEGSGLSSFILNLIPDGTDKEKMMEGAREYLYEKAFNNLLHLDFSNEYHVEQIQKHPKEAILQAINTLIPVFEQNEEYEKCALLKKLEAVL